MFRGEASVDIYHPMICCSPEVYDNNVQVGAFNIPPPNVLNLVANVDDCPWGGRIVLVRLKI